MAAFKIGSFNLIPAFVVTTAAIAGIGALPYGVKWLLNGERPARKDAFEMYLSWKPEVFDATAPYARTYEMRQAEQRPHMEKEWREAHAALAKVATKSS